VIAKSIIALTLPFSNRMASEYIILDVE